MFDGVTIEVVSKKKGWPLRFTNIFGHVSLGHRYVTGWGFFFTKGSSSLIINDSFKDFNNLMNNILSLYLYPPLISRLEGPNLCKGQHIYENIVSHVKKCSS